MISYISLLFVLVSLWVVSYKYLVNKGIRSDITFSVLSMVHWSFAFIYFFSIVYFQLDEYVEQKKFGGSLTQIQIYFHILTCSYYGFDIVAKYFKKQLDAWLTIHHGLTLFFIAIAFFQQQSGSENIYILFHATMCNVPMNVKNIYRILDLKQFNYHSANVLYISIYSINFLIMLPLCLIQFYEENTSLLTFSLLVLLCAQAQLTIFKTLVPSIKRSASYILQQIKVA